MLDPGLNLELDWSVPGESGMELVVLGTKGWEGDYLASEIPLQLHILQEA